MSLTRISSISVLPTVAESTPLALEAFEREVSLFSEVVQRGADEWRGRANEDSSRAVRDAAGAG